MKTESQSHGFIFEEQVKSRINEYLNLITIKYTNKWDIPPVSVKSFKFNKTKSNNRVYFGSIENIFKINDGFFLALIGYEQKKSIKKVVFSDFIFIQASHFEELKGELTLNEIEELSNYLKTFKEGFHNKAREWYKSILPKYSEKSKFQINFKVDSKKQRRIQCSISIEELYDNLKQEFLINNKLEIKDIESSPRQRNLKQEE